jgi:uncharacterized membrane protein
VATPRNIAHLLGLSDAADNRSLLRLVGMRELASGVGVLSKQQPALWLWMRVLGDAMDLSLLRGALVSRQARDRKRVMLALAAVGGITALDVFASVQESRRMRRTQARSRAESDEGTFVRKTITVRRPVEEVYRFWWDFENFPRFMRHLEAVHVTGANRSRWRAEGPGGKPVEWDAELTEDRPNELIAWRSLPEADVDNAGRVRFRPAPGGRGTEVEVAMRYTPPGGMFGRVVAMVTGKAPEQEIDGDLRRLKQVLETGEVTVSDATVEGSSFPQRAARPLEHAALPIGRAR